MADVIIELEEYQYRASVISQAVDVEVGENLIKLVVELNTQSPLEPSFQTERTDIWVAPVDLMTLEFNPNNLKFFINGLKQDVSLVEIVGQEIQLSSEIASAIFPGDVLEFVYNYMEN